MKRRSFVLATTVLLLTTTSAVAVARSSGNGRDGHGHSSHAACKRPNPGPTWDSRTSRAGRHRNMLCHASSTPTPTPTAPTSAPPTSPTATPPTTSTASTPTPTPTPTSTAPATTTPTSAPVGTFAIRVSGNHLVNAGGTVVQLRGANRSGTQYACAEGWGIFDGPSDNASIAAMKSWGFNAVRVNGNEDCWLGINGVPAQYGGANYVKAIVDYVDRITAAGMYVIMDLHHSAPGGKLASGQQPMADRDHSNAYWAGVASAFKSNPAVLFDLYNEPYPDSNSDSTAAWTCVRDGGSCPGVPFTAAGSQEMLNAVRGAGATNVVMVGGPEYAGQLDHWTQYAPADPLHQLAASVHIYWNTPSDPDWSPCYQQSCWENVMAPLAKTTPIVAGEVGEHDCSSGLETGSAIGQSNFFDWADQHAVSYLAWAWFTGNCADEPALISNYNGTPTQYGLGLKNHLAG